MLSIVFAGTSRSSSFTFEIFFFHFWKLDIFRILKVITIYLFYQAEKQNVIIVDYFFDKRNEVFVMVRFLTKK